jgi:menaquinone-9 beta-reductase
VTGRSLAGERPDVLVCGASFAGLAVARELAGSGADVLVLDRAEIGANPTSACAAPTGWLEALGLAAAIRQELPCMRFTTPHGSVRYRLPWSWAAFDYETLCRLLWEQADARFELALVKGRSDDSVHTSRGDIHADLIVDALGWRRVLAASPVKPPPRRVWPETPDPQISRGLEVHPDGTGVDLDVVVDRSLVRRGYCWRVPAGNHVRVGAGSYDPRVPVKAPTAEIAHRLGLPVVRHQGNWFPHRLRPAVEDGVFFVGDSAGHCFALSGEGIRPAFYFGIACGRELRRVIAGEATPDEARSRYAAFNKAHRRGFEITYALQRTLPKLSPRLLTVVIRVLGAQPLVRALFGWYLNQAHPSFVEPEAAQPGAVRRTALTRAG